MLRDIKRIIEVLLSWEVEDVDKAWEDALGWLPLSIMLVRSSKLSLDLSSFVVMKGVYSRALTVQDKTTLSALYSFLVSVLIFHPLSTALGRL